MATNVIFSPIRLFSRFVTLVTTAMVFAMAFPARKFFCLERNVRYRKLSAISAIPFLHLITLHEFLNFVKLALFPVCNPKTPAIRRHLRSRENASFHINKFVQYQTATRKS